MSMFTSKFTSECVVPRSIGLVLRVSQFFGIAPVRLTVKPDGYLVRFSQRVCLFGYAIISAFSLFTIIALGFDLSVPLGESVRMRSETRRVVWVVDVAVVTMLGIVGGYQAPAHIRRLIDFVNRVQKVTSELKASNTKRPQPSDDRQYRYVVIALIILFTIMIADSMNIIYITLSKDHRVWVAAMYSCYYCSYIITQLLEIQFILTAAYVLSALKLINSRLKYLQNKYNQSKNSFKHTSQYDWTHFNTTNISSYWSSPTRSPFTISIQPKSLNKTIDTLAVIKSPRKDHVSTNGRDAQAIRHLSLSYGAVCEIIKEIDKSYGTVLLLLLGSFLLHLIVTLYYIITNIFFDDVEYCMFEKIITPILQAVWCGFHTWDLIMVVEPCHRTHEEMERTKELISQFMCTLTLKMNDPVQIELELFCKRLLFNQVTYSPHQVCTLTRSLIATVLGSITTYLVVIIQL